jgi:hypothetical protein
MNGEDCHPFAELLRTVANDDELWLRLLENDTSTPVLPVPPVPKKAVKS